MSLADTSHTMQCGLLQTIAEALRDRPGETAAQRDARAHDVVRTVLGFRPSGPVEILLAGMVVTHAHLVLDAASDVLRSQDDRVRARARAAIAAMDRGMLGFLKELRAVQTRQIAKSEATSPDHADPTAEAAIVPAPPEAIAAPEPAPAKVSAVRPARTRLPEPNGSPLSPLHRAETSVAAALVALSPPMARFSVAGGSRAASARP